ncbi:unnamed protein product [Rotaria magnacalcarata]|uniref:MIF4G domain-containing protein n=1 Tax=Rotaria magnacalcarata TaxID=392030 RepID=A0A816V0G8_9BILA|nr:unnamed protein product [Rotaria magnacalcarata]CAF2120068.1 unnamed protein product [Rotaria magnacalcarata]
MSKSDESSAPTIEYQSHQWNILEKRIRCLIKNITKKNIRQIANRLFKKNIERGRGLLTDALIKRQLRSPRRARIYAALMSIINSKFPNIGELMCKRVINLFRDSYMNDMADKCFSLLQMISHLINQNILTDQIAIQLLKLVLTNYTDESVELAVRLLKECGQKLLQDSRQQLDDIITTLSNLSDEESLNARSQTLIRDSLLLRQEEFQKRPSVKPGLNFVDKNDQYTHIFDIVSLCDAEENLNSFHFDKDYESNERYYKESQKEILEQNKSNEDKSNSNSSNDNEMDVSLTTTDTIHSSSEQSDDKEN